MDFGGSRKKESVAERAKRERQEREAKKKQEEASQKQAKAAIKIQAWRRNVIAKRKARHSIVEEWDGWMGYEPHDNAQKASRSEATGDIARNVGVFLCFYNWDRKAHADRLSFLCKYLLLPQELLKMATLMEGNRYKVASRIFADFLWACLEKSCEAETNDSMYLTGSELRYLVTVWDIRKWIKNLRGQSVALMSRRSLIDRGAYQVMANALVKRVYAVLRAKAQKTRDAVDEKRMKNCGLWITAILHLSMLSLEKGEEGNKEVQEPYLIVFLVEILSLPLLTFAMDRPGLDNMAKTLDIISAVTLLKNNRRHQHQVFEELKGERALCFVANITILFKTMAAERKLAFAKDEVETVVWVISRALESCNAFISSSSSNTSKYHPIFQWYSGPSVGIPNEFYPLLTTTINFLRSAEFMKMIFADVLAYQFPDSVSSLLENKSGLFSLLSHQRRPEKTITIPQSLDSGAVLSSHLFLNLCRTFQTMRLHILNVLCWTPGLISQLWKLICANHNAYLDAISRESDLLSILQLFCDMCSVVFLTLDDDDLYEKQKPFSLRDISAICVFLNNFCFLVFKSRVSQSDKESSQIYLIAETAKKLLSLLYDKNERKPFGADGLNWIKKEAQKSSFVKDILAKKPEALSVLEHIPHTIPFSGRVEIFRAFVNAEASARDHGAIMVNIHRTRVLEDGFAQLRGISATKLKSTIRVKFVNQHGLAEAGIDQNGVFKEFLEDICKRAFAPDFNLFRVTADGNCVPSITSNIHEEHLYLFDFVGKMLGKALLDGIIIDIPFATFIYAKMLGKMTFLEDLPSLDAQLYKNMIFLKHYDGNAEDLGLSFTVDTDVFGEVQTKDIKLGGRNIEVTNDNKYEYIHLVSDYKLNQECKDQFRALIGGFRSMIPDQFLHIFSPTELKQLMSGDNVDFDIKDLRAHSRYEGGYYDAHPTIRSFWQILQDLEVSERRAFLKFVTSCSSPPVGGFQYLEPPFTIRFVEGGAADEPDQITPLRALGSFLKIGKDASRLPTAATCFNLLKLPAYSKKSTLKAKLTLAIKSASGFELS